VKKKKEMQCVDFTPITLHGMIGGLLKHFSLKAFCGIIFTICKKKKHF